MLRFPDGFLWGAATSAHQVEGDDPSDWTDWERERGPDGRSRIRDGSTSDRACEWWHGRAESDLRLAASLGHNAHRMGISWSRCEPEPDVFDDAALDRYQSILKSARASGLKVMLTLHHFVLPRWAALRGAWLDPRMPERFGLFVDRVARRLGEHVDLWATINEPSVHGFMGYAGTRWPPGAGSIGAHVRAVRGLLRGHAAAYHALHDVLGPGAKVGIVLNAPIMDPAREDRARDRAVAAAQDWAFTGVVLDALTEARFAPPLGLYQREPELARTLDFVGLNYYGRYRVRFDASRAGSLFGAHVQEPTVKTEHVDWGEPHAAGLTRLLVRFAQLGKPLYVTENGVYDPTDALRQRYLVSHVRAVHAAIARGVDVRGYFHWSLIDNFEWAEGWSTPFGLVAVDRETQARTPRESARVYERICRENGVPDELVGLDDGR